MKTVLSASGQVEIPEVFRKADSLQPGQRCDIQRMGRGEYRVQMADGDLSLPNEQLSDVLLSCPVKDWWVESERTERTSLEPPTLFEE